MSVEIDCENHCVKYWSVNSNAAFFWLAEIQLVRSFCLKIIFLLELVRARDFSERAAAVQSICICGLCSFCPRAVGFFFSSVCKLFFLNVGQKIPECLHYANLYLAS